MKVSEKGQSLTGTVMDYIRGLDKKTLLNSTARELMNDAPEDLPKNKATWSFAVSKVRGEVRKKKNGVVRRVGRPVKSPIFTSELIQLSPEGIRTKLKETINAELDKVEAYVKELRAQWDNTLNG